MKWCFVVLVWAACGQDSVPPNPNSPDAAPPGTPIVTVTAPAKSSAFYVTQTIAVAWTVDDDGPSVTCDVTADEGGAAISIATGVTVASGSDGTASWAPSNETPGTGYEVRVACTDATALTGVGTSGMFTLSAPPQQVDFQTQVLPIFAGSCTSSQCHDSVMPQESLDLTAAKAYAQIVGVASKQCPGTQRVAVGDPVNSYLVIKLQGGGSSCYSGSKMPKPPSTISSAQIQLIRDWIFNGAPP